MTLCFTHLKITGFKSFADSTSLAILPGLTGIVGPNGCGKSNIVEAIRWVMGESSARSLRGGEMNDVIFAGTARRAAHNIAEVTLTLDNTETLTEDNNLPNTPALFQDQPQLQISRQIERNSGSQYRLNGKTQRARDIQTLFADLGSGPRSSAIISQNRIAQLISASPEERRQVLEEAAGISGLHNRRREAELKLKATEENLARLDDLKQQLEKHLAELQDQSIQATHYRSFSSSLRETETHLQALYYIRAKNQLDHTKQKVTTAEKNATEKNQSIIEIQQKLEAIQQELSKFRQQEIQARIQWEHPRQQIHNIQNKQKETAQTLKQLNERLEETQHQSAITQSHIEKNEADQKDLLKQIKTLDSLIENHPLQKTETEAKIQKLKDQITHLSNEIKQTEAKLNEAKRCNQSLFDHFEQKKQKKQILETEYQQTLQSYQTCLHSLPSPEQLTEKEMLQQKAQEKVERLTNSQQTLRTEIQNAELEANKLSYHTQQITKNYQQLQHNIEHTQKQHQQLEQEHNVLLKQIDALQSQIVQQQDKEQKQQAIIEVQKKLNLLKDDVKTASLHHQQAIKTRLEQESLYQQAVQTHTQRIKNFNNAQKDWQQAQTNFESLNKQIETITARLISSEILQNQQNHYENAQTSLLKNQQYIEQVEQEYQQTIEKTEKQQALLLKHNHNIHHLKAKQDGLKQILLEMDASSNATNLPAVLDILSLPQEWIPTLAAIFDDTIEAPVSDNMIRGWIELNPLSTNKFSVPLQTLADIIKPPPALQRAFSQIGIVKNKEEGNQLFSELQVGQILATQDGDIWRWDGYYQTHALQSKAAQKLLQKQNLQQIEKELEKLFPKTSLLEEAYKQAELQQETLKKQLLDAKNKHKDLEKQNQKTAQEFFALKNQAQSIQTQWEALQPALQQAQQELISKEKIFYKAQKEKENPAPDSNRIQNYQQEEQKAEQSYKQKQHDLELTEKQFTTLKEEFQHYLHQDEQNQIRLESLKEKQYQLHQNKKQKNHQLATYEAQLKEIEDPQQALQKSQAAQAYIDELKQKSKQLDQQFQQAETELEQQIQNFQQLKDYHIQQKSRLETLEPHYKALKNELDETSLALQQAETAWQNRSDNQELENLLQSLQQDYQTIKEQIDKEQLNYHLILNEKENALKQKEALTLELCKWQAHLTEQLEELKETTFKKDKLKSEIEQIAKQPQLLEQQLAEMQKTEQQALSIYTELQEKITLLEQQKRKTEETLQLVEEQNQKTHENLLRSQAKQEQAEALLAQLASNLTTETKVFATEHPNIDLNEQAERKLKTTISTLTQQREALGAVNLRAELEYQEKQDQLTQLNTQYTELTTAIQQLRESIHKLNQQGKSKLNAIFNEVDQHFQELFSRMFNGGQAYLKLLSHEDPLQAGLEIYAQPPGKKLSTLSLLSGGEQALTALSLVFAVGHCNPVPICILDEVDAPLDDPNVERFCTLLSDMTEQAGTRFLVVTHHQLTMSHMHRLYGVTMQERGISQLISIDLESAVQIQQSKIHEQLEFS